MGRGQSNESNRIEKNIHEGSISVNINNKAKDDKVMDKIRKLLKETKSIVNKISEINREALKILNIFFWMKHQKKSV